MSVVKEPVLPPTEIVVWVEFTKQVKSSEKKVRIKYLTQLKYLIWKLALRIHIQEMSDKEKKSSHRKK